MGLIKKDKINKYTVKQEWDDADDLPTWWSYSSAASIDFTYESADTNVSAKPTKRVQVPKWYDGVNQKGGRKRRKQF